MYSEHKKENTAHSYSDINPTGIDPVESIQNTNKQPFLRIFAGVIFLFIIFGIVLVWGKRETNDKTIDDYTWGKFGGGILKNNPGFSGSPITPPKLGKRFTEKDIYSHLVDNNGQRVVLLPKTTNFNSVKIPPNTPNTEIVYDESSLLDLLSSITTTVQPIVPKNTSDENEVSLSDIFSFVPAEVASLDSTDSGFDERQQSLYVYGNEAGSYIDSFYDEWKDQNLIMKNFFEDRGNPEKIQMVENLSHAIGQIGVGLESMTDVPKEIKVPHDALAVAYKEVGATLEAISKAKTDEELLPLLLKHNKTADKLARKYIAVVTVFSVAGVTFSQTDPGRVFVFTPALTAGGSF